MASSSEGYHEPLEELSDKTRDMHRALVSLQEELEAADWYNQRVDACKDGELRAILAHNRDEEKEHAAMLLEWLRRNDPLMDAVLKTYLFSSGAITEVEASTTAGEGASGSVNSDKPAGPTPPRLTVLTVGSLIGK
jgi:ferritin-like protein